MVARDQSHAPDPLYDLGGLWHLADIGEILAWLVARVQRYHGYPRIGNDAFSIDLAGCPHGFRPRYVRNRVDAAGEGEIAHHLVALQIHVVLNLVGESEWMHAEDRRQIAGRRGGPYLPPVDLLVARPEAQMIALRERVEALLQL